MSFVNAFVKQLVDGEHDFDNDTFKVALAGDVTVASLLGYATYTAFAAALVELSSSGYAAGGTATVADVSGSGVTINLDLGDVSWTALTGFVKAVFVYNATNDKAVLALSTGPLTLEGTNLQITFPSPMVVFNGVSP